MDDTEAVLHREVEGRRAQFGLMLTRCFLWISVGDRGFVRHDSCSEPAGARPARVRRRSAR